MLIGRRREPLEETAALCGRAWTFQADVPRFDQVHAAIDAAMARWAGSTSS